MICQRLTVGSTIPECNSLAVDSWKPETTTPKSGEAVNFVLRSKTPNQAFQIVDMGAMQEISQGTTDENGCYQGSIGPLADGKHQIAICYPVGILCAKFGYIDITWGSKDTDYIGIGLLAAGILGAAYLLTRGKNGN